MTFLLFLLALTPIQFEGHERILHLGCGAGTETAELALQVPDGFVMGIDDSAEAIELAEQRYDLDLIANLQFQRTLPSHVQFDCIGGAACAGDLEALSGALRPGGIARLSLPPEENLLSRLGEAGFEILELEEQGGCVEVYLRR